MALLFLLIGEVNGDDDDDDRMVALDEENVEVAERRRVEQCRDDAREASAPRFLVAVDEKVIMIIGIFGWKEGDDCFVLVVQHVRGET
mmetsp:Transcript_29217/g.60892  ORF Transcript_29217/g.60892 Transcript_29217/m.60892 type:complete len:88 (-) Transcript_29217:30-293(-)